jgi:hypothetical protein
VTEIIDRDGIRCCPCGKTVSFWSAVLDMGYCSDECYWKARKAAGQDEGTLGETIPWSNA